MNSYVEQKILNADPVELIRILYQHGIVSIQDARGHFRSGRTAKGARSILLGAGVIAELDRALRPEAAPEIAGRLRQLYRYMQRRLLEAGLIQDDAVLAEVLGLMTTLSEAWQFESAPHPHSGGLAWQAAMANESFSGGFELCA